MSDLRELYQQVILDHNKSPQNFKKLENANRKVEGYNPLCGDHYTVYLNLEKDHIQDISFEGAGCAISKASASIMTSLLKGCTLEEAEKLFDSFHDVVTGESPSDSFSPSENKKNCSLFSAFVNFLHESNAPPSHGIP